ncbi:universal stress protein [Cupriavidus necator]|uniref:universal stress protein n=1 Tax=Cupriavidus necator TaxID=106590 RepID=UPI003ECECEAD
MLAADGSRCSDEALSQALVIAQATDAEVKVLYVVDDGDISFEASYFDPRELAWR